MKTKKVLQGLALGVVGCSLAFSVTACHGGTRDTETHPVTLAIGALDGNYNPFFYTAQNDGEVTGLTQISLVTADKDNDGKAVITCGQNEATVALAYKETVAPDNSYTTYEYVIKDGIKFSDGEPLTVKDVLFNLYVYLDPYYTGSSTLYATKIKGLSQYRTQRSDSSSEDDTSNDFAADGRQRYQDIIDWDAKNPIPVTPQIEEDAVTVANLFMDVLETTWNNSYQTAGTYTEYNFKEDWEVFYFQAGFISYQRDYSVNPSVRKKDANGKFVMSFDAGGDQYRLRTDMERELEGLTGDARQTAMKNLAIDTVFSEYIRATYGDKDNPNKITAARATVTGTLAAALEMYVSSEALQSFTNDEMSKFYDDLRNEGKLAYTDIEGIKADKVTASEFGSKFTAGSPLDPDKTYDRLTITIDGVDPVAKYNFGITVAPMHYYSGTSDDGVDYVKRAMETNSNDDKVADRFGVKYADKYFFDTVLKIGSNNKSSKPMGAGPYKIRETNADGRLEINKDCAYERNTHFYTVGDGIENANIKYLTYRYVSDDQIVSMLVAGNIDFGMPQCKKENVNTLDGAGHLDKNQYDTNGFGYVGVNPKFVPDITIRRIIMKAMDVADIVATYYQDGEYAKVIRRPITTDSFVYEEGNETYFGEYYKYTQDHTEIEAELVAAGYERGSDGVRVHKTTGHRLKYTFTIAGESTDHPAFSMFKKAETFLNECGFEITVVTDINALQKLAMGNLSVWAAAWSSGVDPDMYQVYHKDSKASAVRNWGYDVILADPAKYAEEYEIIVDELAPLIEDGRTVTAEEARKPIYQKAMNLVMELAVELPTYQRMDMYAYNKTVIDGNSLNRKASGTIGPLNRIWELNYVK